jgi:regulator of PEP synthase PpsR (kinase-PPPase family)
MSNTYQIYLISDSTGETLDRIFLALKAQFLNIEYKVHSYSFTRTENQILKILEDAEKNLNAIILYTIVDNNLAKYLANVSENKKIPCFGVLGNLILNFSKILNQKATHEPSGQHILNEEYYDRIEAIQFTMNHDDGNLINEVQKSDIILVGVSRTSKTPTSIYLANKGFKTSNIPLVNENSLPEALKKNPKMTCVVGLSTEPERLVDLRKNRMNSLKETENIQYTDLENIKKEVLEAKKTFQKYKWPLIDVTRKSVEETAASIIKIHEIYLNNAK